MAMAQREATVNKANKWLVLALLSASLFMVVIDFSIIQIALPAIENQFAVPLSQLQWIVTGYSLTYAGLLILGGRVGDIYGRKKLFVSGLLLFSLASLSGGLAPSLGVLVIARLVQGVGAAIGSATSMSIIMEIFPEGRERNKALSIISAILSSGFAAGVVVGGFMTAAFGWRSVLLVNVPIGIAASIAAIGYIPESTSVSAHKHLDIPGAVSLTAGLMLLVYALVVAESSGLFSAGTLTPLAMAFAILAVFIAIERRSGNPLVPLAFVRRNTVLGANSAGLIVSATMGGLIFIQTIFLQQVLGYSPLVAGLMFLPEAFIFLITSGMLSEKLVRRFGAKSVMMAGVAIAVLGFAVLTTISISGGYVYGLLPGMAVASTGCGLAWTAISIIALEGARKGEEGLASGLFNTSIQVGGPIGLALLLTVASTRSNAVSGAGSTASLVAGFREAFAFAAGMAALALAISAMMRSGGRKADIEAEKELEIAAAPPTMSEGVIPHEE